MRGEERRIGGVLGRVGNSSAGLTKLSDCSGLNDQLFRLNDQSVRSVRFEHGLVCISFHYLEERAR